MEFRSLAVQTASTLPGGKLIFRFSFSVPRFERDLNRERANGGLRSARARSKMDGRWRDSRRHAGHMQTKKPASSRVTGHP